RDPHPLDSPRRVGAGARRLRLHGQARARDGRGARHGFAGTADRRCRRAAATGRSAAQARARGRCNAAQAVRARAHPRPAGGGRRQARVERGRERARAAQCHRGAGRQPRAAPGNRKESAMKFHPRLTMIAALLASGCAAVSPGAIQRLDEARAAYRSAAADPAVQKNAQAELQSAAGALEDAERAVAEGGPSELVEHNAYLAEQRAQIAQRTAGTRSAEAAVAAAGEERRRLQLEAREREEATAREGLRKAEEAKREAESRTAMLEAERLEKQKEGTAAAGLSAEVKRLETELADLRAKETSRGWVLTLKNELLFDTGGSTLKPGAQRALDNL